MMLGKFTTLGYIKVCSLITKQFLAQFKYFK